MIDITLISKYILSLSAPDAGDGISNLKLQKLLYYCQGIHLALYDRPLFTNNIEAWEHGPVVPEMYRKYKTYGPDNIPISKDTDFSELYSDENAKDTIDEVFNVYGQFSAWKLRDMTHEESPWRDTPTGAVISHDLMKAFFKTVVS